MLLNHSASRGTSESPWSSSEVNLRLPSSSRAGEGEPGGWVDGNPFAVSSGLPPSEAEWLSSFPSPLLLDAAPLAVASSSWFSTGFLAFNGWFQARVEGESKRSLVKITYFISFDYEHDRHSRYLLSALKENASSEISFDDLTPEEAQTDDVGRIKAAVRSKLRGATHTLVILGEHANSIHPDREEIEERLWQWWEIEKSVEDGKGLIAVKTESTSPTPAPLYNQGVSWAHRFKVDSILKAIKQVLKSISQDGGSIFYLQLYFLVLER